MKKIAFTTGLWMLMVSAYAQTNNTISLKDSARIFGRDVISNGDFVFNATFTADGNTVFFSKAALNWGYIAIFYSTKTVSGWSEPQAVNFTGTYRDTDPFVSADGKRLYFSSERPVNGMSYKDFQYRYFYVELNGNKIISDPVFLNLPVPSDTSPQYLSVSANGNAYFYMSKDGDADIYVCRWKDGNFMAPEKLPFNDKKFNDFDPIVASDESFIIFCSINRKGFGSVDLWVSFRTADGWTEPLNLGPKVNTIGSDGAPGLSHDNKTLYFASNHEKSPRPVYKNGKHAINKLFHSVRNGMRSIYTIDIPDLKKP